MTALETAISELQAEHKDPVPNTKELEDRIAALEEKVPDETVLIEDNVSEISSLAMKITDVEGDIKMLDDMASDNLQLISDNAAKVASNMMQIASNSVTIASNAAVAIDSDQLASTVASVNATIAANSTKINSNMNSIASNNMKIAQNTAGVSQLSNSISTLESSSGIAQLTAIQQQQKATSEAI